MGLAHSIQNLALFGLANWHFGHFIFMPPSYNLSRLKHLEGISVVL
jgi:hypothetical protein